MISLDTFQTGSLVTGAVTSPVWAPALTSINVGLTTVLTALGIVLTVIKIVQSFTKEPPE